MDFGLISKVELIKDDGEVTLGIIQDSREDKIYVSLVEDNKKFKLLRVGDFVRGVITDDDRVLGFNGLVNQRIHGELPMYEIIYSDVSKIQRREDFRIECHIPVKFTESSQDDEDFNKGFVMDISGGGIRLESNKKLNHGSEIAFQFKYFDDEMMLNGQVVRIGDSDSPNEMKYAYGVKFIHITDEERENIIKNNFVLMRKTSQK